MSFLSISLLGSLAVAWDERPIPTFRSNRVPALLAYLAVEADRPQRRETLMELLWPGLPDASARQNLRQTLYLLRQEVPELAAKSGDDTVPLLVTNRHTVQLNPDGEFFLDVNHLAQLMSGGATDDALTEAVALYQGDFLADFYLPDSENFEEWAAAKRAAYRRLVLEALTQLTAVHLQQANFTTAEQTARRQLEIDNLRESGHRQLMEVLARNGRRRAALSHYETLTRLLQAELAIEPSPETQALIQAIRAGELRGKNEEREDPPSPLSLRPTSTPRHHLPPQPTPFIGRARELKALGEFLADPATRLVSIVGPGGMGKTRLGLAMAERITETEQFANGVFWVNLAPLSEASQIVLALADALNLPLHGSDGRSPQQQLLDYLRQKKLLLLFDNFEHLLGGTDLLTEILQTAPKVQILVTSRERLHVRSEQVYPIEGLAFPDWETVSPTDKEDDESYTAVQLFLQSARRNQPDFALRDSDDLTHLAHICRTVAGMPLALELAASWVDMLPLSEIAAELQQGLDFLKTDMRDMPERHRSVRAAIDYSWQKLDKKEQDIFAGLSVFRGGFTREAAETVVGVNWRQLARLVSKSWLQGVGGKDGRYQIHELLRQYGAEKLKESGEETAVNNRHSRYYCQILGKKEYYLKGQHCLMAMAEIEADLSNIEAAWHWAVQCRLWPDLHQASSTLFWFYALSRRISNGFALFQLTANHLAPANTTEIDDKYFVWVLAKVFTCLARFYHMSSQSQQAETLLQQSQALLESQVLAQEEIERDKAFFFYVKADLPPPHHKEPLGFAQKSLLLARSSSDQWQEAETLRLLGHIFRALSNYEMAQKSFNEVLTLYRSLNWSAPMPSLLIDMGTLARHMTDYQKSEALFKESLSLAQSQAEPMGIADALSYLGYLKLFLGEFEYGANYLQQAVRLQQENGDLFYSTDNMVTLATAYTFSGDLLQARRCIEESLVVAEGLPGILPFALATQARMNVWMGRYEEGQVNINRIFSIINEDEGWGFWGVTPFGLTGWLALAQSNLATASENLKKAVAYNRQSNTSETQEWSAIFQATLSRAEWGLGQYVVARQHLLEALDTAVKMRAFITLLHVLPIAPVFLAAENNVEYKVRAIEIYALAHSHPFIANCQFFYDIAGKDVATIEADLPPDIVATAKARGQALDFWQTAESLLTELRELGWGGSG